MSLAPETAHFGGVLGIAGLALTLAGCTYLTLNVPRGTAGSTPIEPAQSIAAISLPRLEADPQAEAGQDLPDIEPQADTPLSETLNVSLPVSQPAPVLETPPAIVQEAQVETIDAVFIVKFRPDPAIDTVIANWRLDRDAAIEAYSGWAEDKPPFSEMSLVGCSYSGELLLSKSLAVPASGGRSSVSALTSEIRGHSAVAYADPDFTAHPGAFSEDQ